MYDIIIIGAGPAGMTAALYAKRSNKKVLILEALTYGGKIINSSMIDNYPAMPHTNGFDFATNLYNQIKELNCEIKFEKVIKINNIDKYKKEVITKNNTYETKTIIIATGSDVRHLNLDNEKELTGHGISYCATCDGAFFKNKNVAVIGGGDTALEDAIYLSDIASHVYIIHRRDIFTAEPKLIDTLKEKKNIEIIYNSNVVKINGKDKLVSIEIQDKEGKNKVLEITGMFIAIGRIPENENFRDLLELNEFGYIKANENCHTNIPGIFVAGDVREKNLRQLITATSDGGVAAVEAIKYLNNNLKDKM